MHALYMYMHCTPAAMQYMYRCTCTYMYVCLCEELLVGAIVVIRVVLGTTLETDWGPRETRKVAMVTGRWDVREGERAKVVSHS